MELFIKILLTILAGTLMYGSYMYMSHKLIEESVKIKAEVTKRTTRETILEANKIYKPSMSYEGVNNYLNTLISDTFNDRYLENLILKKKIKNDKSHLVHYVLKNKKVWCTCKI